VLVRVGWDNAAITKCFKTPSGHHSEGSLLSHFHLCIGSGSAPVASMEQGNLPSWGVTGLAGGKRHSQPDSGS
jgi:hypothetical protein